MTPVLLAITNTGPLIALGSVDRLHLLRAMSETIAVPEAVRQEVLAGGRREAGVEAFRRAAWIQVAALVGEVDSLLLSHLDLGEASVIQLARERTAGLVILDERKARKIARDVYGMRVVGTVGVLVEAKRKGLLDRIAPVLEEIRGNGYWIDEAIVQACLRQAGEA